MDMVKQAMSAVAPSTQVTEPSHEEWLRADQVEVIKPDEESKARRIGELINKMQQRNFDQHQHMFRGTHVRTLGIVRGTMTVNSDLPDHLQQGIFQSGATYQVIARYANEPTFLQPDNQRAPRGLGMKVFGVHGERLDAQVSGASGAGGRGENDSSADRENSTQDWMFNNAPMVELTDIDTTFEIIELRERYFDSPNTLQGALALRSDRMKQFAPGMLPNTFLMGDTFFTQSSFAHGPFAAHYSLAPASDNQQDLSGQTIPSDAGPTFHRDHLAEHYTTRIGRYVFRAQFASDTFKHAVEDASTEWDINTAPWHDLAIVEFPSQATFSAERRTWWEDKIALSPWNGLKAHRPLGSINRLRKMVYQMSQSKRETGNSQKINFPSENNMPA